MSLSLDLDILISFRLIWAAVILGANIYLYKSVIINILLYIQYNVRSVVSVTYQPELDFPAVTICNYNLFRKSALDPRAIELLTSIYGIQGNKQ